MDSLMQSFGKYRKKENYSKVLLIYLLLGGNDLSKLKWVEEVENYYTFGEKVRKLYGITEDYVNVAEIVNELESIQTPVVCSPVTFEYHSDSKIIHSYVSQDENEKLWVNDIGLISKVMIITETCVVSSNMARPTIELNDNEKGFMYFYEYVLKNAVKIGRWEITYSYEDRVFSITYLSNNGGKKEKIALYTSYETDKAATYKWVIYIIRKESPSISEWHPDNYTEQTYELAGDEI